MLLELGDASVEQGELELEEVSTIQSSADASRLMQALDAVNGRYGRGTVLLASAGLEGERRSWSMKQERRTPAYTTCWEDMPVVRA